MRQELAHSGRRLSISRCCPNKGRRSNAGLHPPPALPLPAGFPLAKASWKAEVWGPWAPCLQHPGPWDTEHRGGSGRKGMSLTPPGSASVLPSPAYHHAAVDCWISDETLSLWMSFLVSRRSSFSILPSYRDKCQEIWRCLETSFPGSVSAHWTCPELGKVKRRGRNFLGSRLDLMSTGPVGKGYLHTAPWAYS